MKAKNSEKIIRGYLEFAGGLLISTALVSYISINKNDF